MKKGNLTGGLILVLLGVWFLAVQFIPRLAIWAKGGWPLAIIALAIIFLLISILNKKPGFSIPAFIIGGFGMLLYYQNATGNWDSWAYAWTLIPGFIGLGLLVFGLQSQRKGAKTAGLILLFVTLALFFIFGSFLGAPKRLIRYWPLLLIILGVWSMFRAIVGNKEKKDIIDAEPPIEETEVEKIEKATEEIVEEKNETGEENES